MDRRHFFKSASAAGSSLLLPASLLGTMQDSHAKNAETNQQATLFLDNLKLTPLRGFLGQNISCDYLQVEGKIPNDLRGVFYRNGPGLFERGGQRYHHWFDGDGLVHAWRFTDQGVSHQARFVGTKKFIAESKAQEFLVPAFGTQIKAKIPVRSSDTMNTANTNVIQLNGQLLAMWEGGSAHAMDADTLATKGIVNWSDELTGMPFSAHPKVERDGSVWNFGTQMGKMVLYHISSQGKLLRHAVFDAPASAMVHDFAVSQNHLIFLMPPIELDMQSLQNGSSLAESMIWKGSESTKVLVVDKNDFSKRKLFELPAMMVFHFGNAWEENGNIHIDFVRSDDVSNLTKGMVKMMRGEDAYLEDSNMAMLKINLQKSRLDIQYGKENVEFPRIDPRFVAQKNRFTFYPCSRKSGDSKHYDGVMRLDKESGKIDQYYFNHGVSLEEHVVVPKPGTTKEGDAWLIGVGFDFKKQTSFATIFEAENLSNGPIAIVHLPYWIPSCFHGNFY